MAQWYVKDLSKLTGISVQTLHHYDRIDLLKPISRLESGYRLYSEKDLLKLQQIIALKFFGFELSQIKTLLAGNVDTVEHFSIQASFLAEKANALLKASQTLKGIIDECSHNKS
jgi:DNA-binding transcriptional MerR regulator